MVARVPSASGKTRLTAGLPGDEARALREALFRDTLAVVRALDVPVTVAYTPDDGRDEMAALVGEPGSGHDRSSGTDLRPQRGGDLGARMQHAIAESFDAGAEQVVVIGSDLPTLPPAHLADAFAKLESGVDCVFGPADDGGYYLVGVRRGATDYGHVFTGIPWGTDRVLEATLAAAHVTGLTTALVDAWFDVDVRADLHRVVADTRLAQERRNVYRRFLPGFTPDHLSSGRSLPPG